MIKFLLYSILSLTIISSVYSQAPTGYLTNIEVSKELDTLLISRQYGNWWFGPAFGYNYNVYYGDLKISRDLFTENNPFYTAVDFNGGTGGGYHIGGLAEWLPPDENWGAQLRITFLDFRDNNTETIPENDEFRTSYTHFNKLNYLTISPSVRYNFLFKGLHLFGGLDLEINYQDKAYNEKEFYNPEYITQKSNISFNDINTRLGFHVGFGYDIFMLDYNKRTRIRFTPYVSLHYGTRVISDNNSNWNTLLSRLGMAIKIGPDNFVIDTIKYDPTYAPPPVYLASANIEIGIEFPDYRFAEALPSAQIGYVRIGDFITREDTIDLSSSEVIEAFSPEYVEEEDIAVDIPQQSEIRAEISSNELRRFTYPTSATTDITPEILNYLDNIVRLYEENRNIQVRVVGHSDNTGSLIQNTERSNVRAERVKEYLISKGLPEGAILSTGVGSIEPVAPINTPEGRARNRRVEITVVQ